MRLKLHVFERTHQALYILDQRELADLHLSRCETSPMLSYERKVFQGQIFDSRLWDTISEPKTDQFPDIRLLRFYKNKKTTHLQLHSFWNCCSSLPNNVSIYRLCATGLPWLCSNFREKLQKSNPCDDVHTKSLSCLWNAKATSKKLNIILGELLYRFSLLFTDSALYLKGRSSENGLQRLFFQDRSSQNIFEDYAPKIGSSLYHGVSQKMARFFTKVPRRWFPFSAVYTALCVYS